MAVNHKRVLRLMEQDNLLSIQPKAFVVTTQSEHELKVYLNLAWRMELTGLDQLWVAAITYLRLRREFVYLAMILDAFSRKAIGWELGRSLAAELTLAALRRALAARTPPPGLVHHSDRGMQYACATYVDLLEQHRVLPSMSRPGNPYDNAKCESFMKTLKREEIYDNEYADMQNLRAHLEEFIDGYYNRQRLHSALGYRSPQAFENQAASQTGNAHLGASMSFSRHGEIYLSDGGRKAGSRGARYAFPPTHRMDESPAGYSSAGCSPAEPPPLRQPPASLTKSSYEVYKTTASGKWFQCCVSQPRGSPQQG